MTKQQWLEERILVDRWGRPPGMADVPLRMMSRKEAFAKRKYEDSTITSIWNSVKEEYSE